MMLGSPFHFLHLQTRIPNVFCTHEPRIPNIFCVLEFNYYHGREKKSAQKGKVNASKPTGKAAVTTLFRQRAAVYGRGVI